MSKNFSETLTLAKLVVAGIGGNLEALKSVSLGEKEASSLEKAVEKLRELDARQEKLKADLKTCTADLESEYKDLSAKLVDAKKRIKLVIPQSQWKEFGIEDKR